MNADNGFKARRSLLKALAASLAIAGMPAMAAAGTRITVYKSPDCGCCNDWIRILEANGFAVEARNVGNDEIRKRMGLPERYGSCHTGVVDGYLIEGHVPVREIRRLLKEKPVALGIAVPGMPVGSPGMDGPEYRGRKDPYDVLLVRKDGSHRVYQRYT